MSKKAAALSAVILTLIILSVATLAFAQTYVSVTIGTPSNPQDLGVTSGSYWIGEFPVTVTDGGTNYPDEVFCLNCDGVVYEGTQYQATIAPATDNSTWRAISYVLTWDSPTTNTQAEIDQVAIWKILGEYTTDEFNLGSTIINEATSLASTATGKDVARQGDQLAWVSPSGGNINGAPGQTLTYEAQLTESNGQPRPNVQVDFTATLQPPSGSGLQLNSTYVSTPQAFTNSNGVVQVSIKVPIGTQIGSTITVQASTQGTWPQEFLDLTNENSNAQNLVGLEGTLNLTVTTSISITGFIQVMPESAIGSITIIAAFGAAFAVYKKLAHRTTIN